MITGGESEFCNLPTYPTHTQVSSLLVVGHVGLILENDNGGVDRETSEPPTASSHRGKKASVEICM